MEILLFIFVLIIFIGMLVGGHVVKNIKKIHKAAQQAADKREQQFRDEVGRQRQQYSQRAQPKNNQQQTARRTETATGETIIDHHHKKRGNRKIFDDEEGEYTDFVEVKD
jgi:predicted Holliday junction resolvase-like endonuclease